MAPDKKKDLPFPTETEEDEDSTSVSAPPKFDAEDEPTHVDFKPEPEAPALGDDEDEPTHVLDWERATRKSIEKFATEEPASPATGGARRAQQPIEEDPPK